MNQKTRFENFGNTV